MHCLRTLLVVTVGVLLAVPLSACAASSPKPTPAERAPDLEKRLLLKECGDPFAGYKDLDHVKVQYPGVYTGPSEFLSRRRPIRLTIVSIEGGNGDAMNEVLQNSIKDGEIPAFQLICFRGQIEFQNGVIQLYQHWGVTTHINVFIGSTLPLSAWHPKWQDSIQAIVTTPDHSSYATLPSGKWPWQQFQPRVVNTKMLAFDLPYAKGQTLEYLLNVEFNGNNVPVDPQIINH